jgi:hypothetical protein
MWHVVLSSSTASTGFNIIELPTFIYIFSILGRKGLA